ncbi:MAG: PDZ domain-containing protein [Planctomycetes bacterium]|nr:PDZ domain-containing protein [Planctomycetota bacterium]
MIRSFAVLVSALLLSLHSCVTHRAQLRIGSADRVLVSRTGADGATERFVLDIQGGGDRASLRVQTEYDKKRPFLGFQLLELDRDAAAARGLEPYSGLIVQGTYEHSSARRAGVVPGDVLIELAGSEATALSQVADIEAGLTEGQKIVARIRRGDKELGLELVTKVLDERVTDTEDVALDSVQSHKPYAGVTLRGIPAHWCERIYGERRNAIVIAGVEVGSPAWLAGLRSGDIIDRVDGMPVPELPALARTIAERGEVGQPIRLQVSRAAGDAFEASVDLHDYSGETNFWIPLVTDIENGVYRDRWSIGPLGLIMSNRNTYLADSSTRAVGTRNVFSALLGLIRVETTPDNTAVRLLWFIRYDS